MNSLDNTGQTVDPSFGSPDWSTHSLEFTTDIICLFTSKQTEDWRYACLLTRPASPSPRLLLSPLRLLTDLVFDCVRLLALHLQRIVCRLTLSRDYSVVRPSSWLESYQINSLGLSELPRYQIRIREFSHLVWIHFLHCSSLYSQSSCRATRGGL